MNTEHTKGSYIPKLQVFLNYNKTSTKITIIIIITY